MSPCKSVGIRFFKCGELHACTQHMLPSTNEQSRVGILLPPQLLRRNKLRWITENLDIVGVVINCKSLTVICPSPTMQPPFLKVFSSSHPGMHLSMTWHDRTGGCPSRLTRTSTSALRTGFHYSLSLSLLHPTLLCHLWVSSTSMFWFSHSSLSCFRNPDQDLRLGIGK